MAVEYYMLMGNAPDSCSILKGVEKLQPGCYMVYDLGERKVSRIEPYWELSFIEDNNTNFEEIKRQVREKVEESVIRRLICDVPFGAFLSGGLDSSIIVAVMSKHVKELKTFSISFDYPDFNESQYSRLVSEKFNTRHFEIPFRAEDIKQLIPELPYYYDEPFADPSMIATSLVCSVARKHVTVSLSGTGGDELFGGYARYSEFAVLKALNNMKKMLKWPLRIGNKTAIFLLKSDKLSKLDFFLGQKEPGHIIYLKLLSYMFRDRGESQKDLSRLNYFAEYFKYDDQLANLLNCDIHNYLPSCLLVKEDRAAMAVSLEARVPFLDHELVELAGRVPSKYKINGTDKKYILKKAFEDVLPKEILSRKKMGFGVPLVHYFRRELKDYAYSEIFEFDGYDYYSKDYLMELWQRHQHRRNDYSRIFWSIIMFNQWYRRWMSGL